MPLNHIYKDIDTFELIEQERRRLETQITLIASENYASPQVMAATGSVLTNKYAEGYPRKRYYGGCNIVDQIEILAQQRCTLLFGADHVNVQPHAGSQANLAAYMAVLKPGDTIMGLSLAEGGHLTHGHTVNISGILYKAIPYCVDRNSELLDYTEIEKLAYTHKPKLIIAGASAYARTIDFARFGQIADAVGAVLLADIAHIAGLIATQLHPSPIGHAAIITSTTHKTLRGPRGGLIMSTHAYAESIDKAVMPGTQGGPFMHAIAAKAVGFYEALQPDFKNYQKQVIANAQHMARVFQEKKYRIVTGGTDNHLFVIDLRHKKITGRAAEAALEKTGIIVSRSTIPFDTQKPWITSGIRLGTPAATTRGMKEKEMELLAALIDEALTFYENESKLALIAKQVHTLAAEFPVYSS